jgi:hypothetical protein
MRHGGIAVSGISFGPDFSSRARASSLESPSDEARQIGQRARFFSEPVLRAAFLVAGAAFVERAFAAVALFAECFGFFTATGVGGLAPLMASSLTEAPRALRSWRPRSASLQVAATRRAITAT